MQGKARTMTQGQGRGQVDNIVTCGVQYSTHYTCSECRENMQTDHIRLLLIDFLK